MAITVAQMVAVIQIQGADKAKQDIEETGKSAEKTKQSFGEMFKQGLANAASFAIFNVGASALNLLKNQFTDTIQTAIQHQQVMAQTAQAIKSTGGAAGLTAQSISDLAMSLSKVTPFSDDVIQSGENMLLTFTGIGKDVFPQATKTMLDMAQAMGMDTKSAAMQLGKALNDPAQGLSALSREGVTFSESQKNTIKQMVAMGNTAGAQKIMLAELQKEFGGSAEAAGKTFGGQLQILQNNLEDTKQAIGTALLPVLSQLTSSVTSMVMPAVNGFANFLQTSAFQNFASGVGQQIVNGFSKIGDIVKNNVTPIVNDFIGVIKSPQFKTFEGSLGNLATTLGSSLKPALNDIKPLFHDIFDFIKNDGLPALTGLSNNLSTVINWMRQNHGAIADVTGVLATLFIPAIIKSGVESVIAGAKTTTQFVSGIIKAGVEGWQAAGKIGLFVANIIKTGVESAIAGGKVALEFVGNIIKSGAEAVTAGAKIALNFVGNIIKSGAEAVIAGGKIALEFVGNVIKAGAEAVIAGAKIVANFIGSMIATGAQAVISGAQMVASFVAGLITAGAEAIVSAGIFLATLVPSLLAVAAATIAATWPYLLIAAVVAAAVVGIVLAVQHWGEISNWLLGVWQNVSTWFQGFWHGIVSLLGNIGGWFHDRFTEAYNNIKNIIGNLGPQALQWGMDMIQGFINGIENMIGNIGKAAGAVADKIRSFLHFSKPDVGPLVDVDNWMPDFGDILAKGLSNQVSKVQAPALQLASSLKMSLNPVTSVPNLTALPAGIKAIPPSVTQSQQQIVVYVQSPDIQLDGTSVVNKIGPRMIKTTRTSGPIRSNV